MGPRDLRRTRPGLLQEGTPWTSSSGSGLAGSILWLPSEDSPGAESLGEGTVCTKCLSLPEACRSPGHGPQMAGHPPRAGRMEGALSDSIPQASWGTAQAPLAQGSASSPSAWGGGGFFLSLPGPAAAVPHLLPSLSHSYGNSPQPPSPHPRLTPAADTQAQT